MFQGTDPDIDRYGRYIACAHFVFVAVVIAVVFTTKAHEKRKRQRTRELQGARAPTTPVSNDVGAFAFPIDKTQDFLKVWSPRNRVFAAS